MDEALAEEDPMEVATNVTGSGCASASASTAVSASASSSVTGSVTSTVQEKTVDKLIADTLQWQKKHKRQELPSQGAKRPRRKIWRSDGAR